MKATTEDNVAIIDTEETPIPGHDSFLQSSGFKFKTDQVISTIGDEKCAYTGNVNQFEIR